MNGAGDAFECVVSAGGNTGTDVELDELEEMPEVGNAAQSDATMSGERPGCSVKAG